jgi:hypothetical protein
MKYNLKTLSLVVALGSLFYFISSYTKSKLIVNTNNNTTKQLAIIPNKTEDSSKLAAPKVYISIPAAQNGLGIGNNWKSR